MKITLLCLMVLAALPFCAQEPKKIYAQNLVNESLAKFPDVVILAMHVKSPTNDGYPIIASNIGRLGKKADEDDMRVIDTGKNNLEVNKTGNHFEVELPLQDASKKTIGAIGVVFNYKLGDNKTRLEKRATKLRDELRGQIPDISKLFETVQ
jgi:acetamidase/formamidase